MLVTLREPVVLLPAAPPPDDEPDPALEHVLPIPLEDADGQALGWSYRQATGLRFERWRADRGEFDDDLVGDAPEPLPPIVREART